MGDDSFSNVKEHAGNSSNSDDDSSSSSSSDSEAPAPVSTQRNRRRQKDTAAAGDVDITETASIAPSIATTSNLGGKAKLESLLGPELAKIVLQIVKLHRSITAQKNEIKRDPRHIALKETTRQLNLAKKNARQAICNANRSEVRFGGIKIALKQTKKTRKPEDLKAAVSQACLEQELEPETVQKLMSAINSEPVVRINVSDVKPASAKKVKGKATTTAKTAAAAAAAVGAEKTPQRQPRRRHASGSNRAESRAASVASLVDHDD